GGASAGRIGVSSAAAGPGNAISGKAFRKHAGVGGRSGGGDRSAPGSSVRFFWPQYGRSDRVRAGEEAAAAWEGAAAGAVCIRGAGSAVPIELDAACRAQRA